MSDSSSADFAFEKIGFFTHKAKIIILASTFTVAAAAPVVYTYTQEKPKTVIAAPKEDLVGEAEDLLPKVLSDQANGQGRGDNFVMSDDFFNAVEPHSKAEEEDELEHVNLTSPHKKNHVQIAEHGDIGQKPANLIDAISFRDPEPRKVVDDARANNLSTSSVIPPIVAPTPSPAKISTSPEGKKGETKYLHKEAEDKKDQEIAELLTDKDFPNTVASIPYDLSRMLTTDSFIPAVMYTSLNSEIPSKTVLAVVESDIVGFHGRNILIPKGSKIEGVYEALGNKHARRIQISWFKITRPDGIIIKLDAESADMEGAGGLSGELDQRLKDRYGAAILLSSINALAQMSVQENDVRQLAAVESFSRETATTTAQIIRENLNVMPIIKIAQGARINIRPSQNIYFPKPKNNEIKVHFINE